MLGQAQTRNQVLEGLQHHGAAPGARRMIDWEEEAAELAIQTGIYGAYRSSNGQDCTRIGPSSKCFCGHLYNEHTFVSKKSVYPRCTTCACEAFKFVPTRPEEVGDWWLVRRKGFNVHTWRAKCRCGHSHEEHDPKHMRCRCGCARFTSNFACLACDKLWEDHETVFETVQERLAQGKPVGEDFRPLADDLAIRQAVFPGDPRARGQAREHSYKPSKVRPAQVAAQHAEKSVQIMHESSGGRVAGQGVANRWGRVPQPPQEWLYMGGRPAGGLVAGLPEDGPQLQRGGDVTDLRGSGAGAQRASTSSKHQQGACGRGAPRVGPGALSVKGNSAGRVVAAAGQLPASQRHGAHGSGTGSDPQPKQLASGFRPVYD